MSGELDTYYRTRGDRLAVWRPAGELRLTTDYEVAVDTAITRYGDSQGLNYNLPGGTHFSLTDAKSHRVMWTDSGVVVGIPNEQLIPITKPSKT